LIQKRPNKRRRNGVSRTINANASLSTATSNKTQQKEIVVESEIRPLVRAKKIEAGEDYWIDEKDLQKSLERKRALKNRKVRQLNIQRKRERERERERKETMSSNKMGGFKLNVYSQFMLSPCILSIFLIFI